MGSKMGGLPILNPTILSIIGIVALLIGVYIVYYLYTTINSLAASSNLPAPMVSYISIVSGVGVIMMILVIFYYIVSLITSR